MTEDQGTAAEASPGSGGSGGELGDLAKALGALGMGEDEAMVYLRLLQSGPAKVSQLSSYFELSRSTLYRLLDELADKGFVSKSLDRPTVYTPAAPEQVFEIGHQHLRSRLDHLESVRERTLERLRTLAGTDDGDDAHHWKRLQGASRIYEVIQNCARNADTSIEGVSNHELFQRSWMPIVEKAWRILAERGGDGVDVRLLLGYEDPIGCLPEGLGTETLELRRFQAQDTLHFLLFDREEIVLVVRPTDGATGQKDAVAIWTDAPGVLATHKALFRQHWPEGQALEGV